jgi:Glycosyltransferase
MTSHRIVFLNRFYWPDEPATAQLLVDLAEALARHGEQPVIVTSSPVRRRTPRFEERHGVAIHRVFSPRFGGAGLLARILAFTTFYPLAFLRLLRVVRRGDTLVAMTDPPLSGVLAGFVARLRGARLVHWVQDIYPEIAVTVTGHRWLLASRPARDAAWRQAIACVVPGETMARTVLDAGVTPARVIVSPNWAPAGLRPPLDADVAALRSAWGLEGKFVAAYSGNLGRVHDLPPLLEIAEHLRDDPSFILLFIGGGAGRIELEQRANQLGLRNVRFLRAQPRDRLAASLGVGDVHFVTLKPGAEHCVFPSKLYGIAQVGRPVVFIGAPDADVAKLVATHAFGQSFTREETPRVAAWLRHLRSTPALQADLAAAALRFAPDGRETALAQWRELLGSAVPSATASTP